MDDGDLSAALNLDYLFDNEVVPTSSPGVPYVLLGKDNRTILSGPGRDFIRTVLLTRFRLLLQTPLSYLASLTAEQLVEGGFCDPVKVFVKNEPHKVQKLRDGRYRIISNVSLVDSLLERVLFRKQNQLEIARWQTCPSKPGMGLHDEGLQALYDLFVDAQARFPLAESDVSGWDWNVKGWMMEDDMLMRASLAGARRGSPFYHMLMARYHCVSLKVFVLSDGSMVAQRVRGIQASGSYNTSAGNSRMRVHLAYVVGVGWVVAMGDDDVEEFDESGVVVANYRRLGIPLKDYKLCGQGSFEFCSTRFEGSWQGVPVNVARTIYRYLSHSPASRTANPEFRAQLANDLRHHPRQQEYLALVDSITELESKPCQQ